MNGARGRDLVSLNNLVMKSLMWHCFYFHSLKKALLKVCFALHFLFLVETESLQLDLVV